MEHLPGHPVAYIFSQGGIILEYSSLQYGKTRDQELVTPKV